MPSAGCCCFCRRWGWNGSEEGETQTWVTALELTFLGKKKFSKCGKILGFGSPQIGMGINPSSFKN